MSADDKRRRGDRRRQAGDRRGTPRNATPDRRQGQRRGLEALSTGALLATLSLAGNPAQAQIYTRRNDRGVMEATNTPDQTDYRLTYPGKGTLIHSSAWRLRPTYSGEFDADIVAAAARHGVSVNLVRAVIQVESDYDHLAVSSKGAQGLMQLMPDTGRRMGVSNAFDPRQNIFGGVRYLRLLLDQFQGDVRLATAAYNAGPNAVVRHGGVPPYRETRGYVQKIQALLASVSSGVQAAFFAPSPRTLDGLPASSAAAGPDAKAGAIAPSRASGKPVASGKAGKASKARLYYRWKDDQGVLHVGQTPPPAGTSFTLIRALD
ncbi:MAG TPA: lytic transglycosylase domain-containing protein [Vicinamibacteria bacterium]|nr:lytic transglycosylase domain-containing protein [Vicinamibacteria bacterium]